jgi:chemotaxis protein MotB
MFALGSARMFDRTKRLLGLVTAAIRSQPNKIRVTGHTDSIPFRAKPGGYGNWELSSDRAQAARRALIGAGLKSDRIASVAGRADRDPLVPADPTNARNRRISIILLRTVQPPGAKPKPKAKPAAKKPAPDASRTKPFERDWTGPRVR